MKTVHLPAASRADGYTDPARRRGDLLDALNAAEALTVPTAAARTMLAPTSVRRTLEAWVEAGLLDPVTRHDPDTHRPARTYLPSLTLKGGDDGSEGEGESGGENDLLPLFPVVDLTSSVLRAHLFASRGITDGDSSPSSVSFSPPLLSVSFDPFGGLTDEESLRILLSRLRQGIPSVRERLSAGRALPLFFPVLLLADDAPAPGERKSRPAPPPADPPEKYAALIREALEGGIPGAARCADVRLLSLRDAWDGALTTAPWASGALSLLLLSARGKSQNALTKGAPGALTPADVTLRFLCRSDPSGCWFAPRLLEPLASTLADKLAALPMEASDGVRAVFISRLLRTLPLAPDVVILDGIPAPGAEAEDAGHLSSARILAPGDPFPLYIRGAASRARRDFWENFIKEDRL